MVDVAAVALLVGGTLVEGGEGDSPAEGRGVVLNCNCMTLQYNIHSTLAMLHNNTI